LAQNPFEIPQQLRDMAEKNVQVAQSAYGQFMDAMSQAMNMWASAIPANDMTAGFKAVQDRAAYFAKQNADAAFSVASEITNAKTIQDVVALQTRYAQMQMQAYAMQTQELGKMVVDSASKMKPMR